MHVVRASRSTRCLNSTTGASTRDIRTAATFLPHVSQTRERRKGEVLVSLRVLGWRCLTKRDVERFEREADGVLLSWKTSQKYGGEGCFLLEMCGST